MPATIDLAGAEIELVSMVAREGRLRVRTGGAQGTQLRLRLHRLPTVTRAADDQRARRRPEVLIPIQCEYYALEGVGQLLRNIEMVKAHLNPELNVTTVVLTMYDGRNPTGGSGGRRRAGALSATRCSGPSSRAA